jgi:hypothetical protein
VLILLPLPIHMKPSIFVLSKRRKPHICNNLKSLVLGRCVKHLGNISHSSYNMCIITIEFCATMLIYIMDVFSLQTMSMSLSGVISIYENIYLMVFYLVTKEVA